MRVPFGKRNLPPVTKPTRAKLHKHGPRPSSGSKSRFYLLVAVSIAVLVVGGYALAL
jgi:hypothetical protein